MARYALVIGIAEYNGSFKKLETPVTNANAIAKLLEQHGNYQVGRLPFRREAGQKDPGQVISKPLTYLDLVRDLQQFFQDANGSDVLLYYSGHGFTLTDPLSGKREGFLAASDCQVELNSNKDIIWQKNGISLEDLNTLISQHQFGSLVVILDCCNSGAFLESDMVRRDATAFGFQRDYYLITACRSSSKAYEGPTYSLLTDAVRKGLERSNASPSGWITGDRLFAFIGEELRNSRQEPLRLGWGRMITLVHYDPQPEEAEAATPTFNPHNPYVGLRSFEPEQAEYFYGREQDVRELLQKLREGRFLAVIGPSGCGKSSLVKAGLLPELADDLIPGSREWQPVICTPGQYPLNALDDALGRYQASGKSIVLFVDQFEELFTLSPNEEYQRQFINRLAELSRESAEQDQPVRIIVAMRGDFLDRCARFEESRRLINRSAPSTYMVTPLTEIRLIEELRKAIVEPAALHGVTFEAGLVSRIVEDVTNQTGALPLLQYALTELWDTCIRDGQSPHYLSLEAYETIGGVKGALQRRANQFYTSLTADDKAFVRGLLLELVKLGEEGTVTRRRVSWERLREIAADPAQLNRIINQLTYQRLLVADDNTVEVAHEALLSESPLIRQWIEESRDSLRLSDRLKDYCREWQDNHQSDDYLLDAGRLAAIEEWIQKHCPRLTQLESSLVEKSRQRRDRELKELKRLKEEAEARAALEKQKRQIVFRSWLLVAGLLSSVAISALIVAAQARKTEVLAQEKQVETLTTLADTYFKDNQQLEALIASVKALKALKNSSLEPDEYITRLQPIIYGTQETNRWLANSEGLYGLGFNHSINRTSDDHEVAIASSGSDKAIKLWSLRGRLITTLNYSKATLWNTVFSYDGRLLASTGSDGKVQVWDLEKRAIANVFPGHSGRSYGVAFTTDNSTLVSSGSDGVIKIWKIGDERKEVVLLRAKNFLNEKNRSQTYKIFDVDINPMLKNLIAYGGDNDNGVWLWDFKQKQPTLLGNHNKSIFQVRFSPDGSKLATCSNDGVIKIWSVISRSEAQLLTELQANQLPIYSIDFSRDGNLLVSAGEDQTIRVWDIEKTIKLYKSSINRPVQQKYSKGVPLKGHNGSVNQVKVVYSRNLESEVNRNGLMIISASTDRTIRLWKWNKISSQDRKKDPQELFREGCSSLKSYINLNSQTDLSCP